MLKFLFIVSSLLIQLSSSSPNCTPAEMKSMKNCESEIAGLRESIKAAKNGTASAETLARLNSNCKKAIDCVGKNQCSTFINSVEKPCQLIEPFSEAFSCFSNVITLISKTPEKYPCLKENDIDQDSQYSLCKLMTTAKPCFDHITKQICGEKVNIDKIHQLAQPYLICA